MFSHLLPNIFLDTLVLQHSPFSFLLKSSPITVHCSRPRRRADPGTPVSRSRPGVRSRSPPYGCCGCCLRPSPGCCSRWPAGPGVQGSNLPTNQQKRPHISLGSHHNNQMIFFIATITEMGKNWNISK